MENKHQLKNNVPCMILPTLLLSLRSLYHSLRCPQFEPTKISTINVIVLIMISAKLFLCIVHCVYVYG